LSQVDILSLPKQKLTLKLEMEEIWKDIIGFEGCYQISSLGRVKSLGREVYHARYGKQTIKSHIMKLNLTKDGYLRATLKKGTNGKFLAHRLVAIAFIPNTESKLTVNHKNGIKTDNRLENLEWMTSSENITHSYKINLRSGKGQNNNFSKLTDSIVLKIRNEHRELKLIEIAKIYGVSKSVISAVKNRRTWKHI
jgi:hypothetical protein